MVIILRSNKKTIMAAIPIIKNFQSDSKESDQTAIPIIPTQKTASEKRV